MEADGSAADGAPAGGSAPGGSAPGDGAAGGSAARDGGAGDGGDARLTARAEGRVQGVGFRAAVWRQAARLGLSGWAANLDDGSVEVVAEGPRARCQELLAWLEGGGTPGRVRRVTHRLGAPLGGLSGFSAR